MTALADELTNDPLSRGYAGMTDKEAADSIALTADRTVYRQLNAGDLNAWAMGGPMMKIKRAIDADTAGDATLSVAYGAWRMLERDDATYNPNDAEHTGMVDTLIAASILTETDKTALHTRAASTVTRAQELNLGKVREGTVKRARAK